MGYLLTGQTLQRRDLPRVLRRGVWLQRIARRNFLTGLSPLVRKLAAQVSLPYRNLDELPAEVLYRIFCYAGVGESNSLPKVNKYLHSLFSPRDNVWFLERLIANNFVVHLNTFNADRWKAKFRAKVAALPESIRDDAVDKYYSNFEKVCDTSDAMDFRLFEHQFANARVVQLAHAKFGGIVIDQTIHDDELAFRERYLQWQYMVLSALVELVKDCSEPVLEEVQAKAEQDEQCVAFIKKHELEGYSPAVSSMCIPKTILHRIPLSKLPKLLALHSNYNMEPESFGLLVTSVFRQNPGVDEHTFASLMLLAPKAYNAHDVVALLEAYNLSRDRLHNLPREERSAHSALTENMLSSIKDVFAAYYETPTKPDDELIWSHLKGADTPELVDYLFSLGATPSIDIF